MSTIRNRTKRLSQRWHTVRVSKDTHRMARHMAREADRSMAWVIERALTAYAQNGPRQQVEQRPALEVRA